VVDCGERGGYYNVGAKSSEWVGAAAAWLLVPVVRIDAIQAAAAEAETAPTS
jgi:hypothetical protein